jgi:tetratricopeptide (TPR) repeat protein
MMPMWTARMGIARMEMARMRKRMGLPALLLLTACGQAPTVVQEPEPVVPSRDLVAEVRAVGLERDDALDVHPLRDPVVEDLRRAALAHERARRFEQADEALQRALALIPGDPELLQSRAEIALFQQQYDQAEALASASFDHGPRLGGLCRRNWATVRVAREMRGNLAGAAEADARTQRCTVEPPVRM